MLRLASDADFNNDIVRGLRRRQPDLDLVRAQDVDLRTAGDPVILEWAATEGRVLLTHDRSTMPDFAFERVRAGLPMPGVFVVRNSQPLGPIIEELLLLAACSLPEEWKDQVLFLPL